MRLFRRPGGAIEEWQPRLYAVLIALVLIVLWLIAFIVKNDEKVQLDFVLLDAHLSLIWLIILLLAIGFLGGVLTSQLYRRPRSMAARTAEARRRTPSSIAAGDS
jgi:uncharacterized integral membrane protein